MKFQMRELFGLTILNLSILSLCCQSFGDVPTKATERAEAVKLVKIACEKLPHVLSQYQTMIDSIIQKDALDVELREASQVAKDTSDQLKTVCDQKLNLEAVENAELSKYMMALKAPVLKTSQVANYLVLNYSSGATDTDKSLSQSADSVNLLAGMIDGAAKFFASKYAH